MQAEVSLLGTVVEVVYHVKGTGSGVNTISINGASVNFTREPNPYRPGAARVGTGVARSHLGRTHNTIVIGLGQ